MSHSSFPIFPCVLKEKKAQRDALQQRLQQLMEKQKQQVTRTTAPPKAVAHDTASKDPPAPKQAAQPPAPKDHPDPKQPPMPMPTAATNVGGEAEAVAASVDVANSSGNSPVVGKMPPTTPPQTVRRKLFHSPEPSAAEAAEPRPAVHGSEFVDPRLAKKFDVEPDRCPYSSSDLRVSSPENLTHRPAAAPLRGETVPDTRTKSTVLDDDSPHVTCHWIRMHIILMIGM